MEAEEDISKDERSSDSWSPSVPQAYGRATVQQRAWLACVLSHAPLFATPRTVAHQAPLSVGFPKQEYWSGQPSPPLCLSARAAWDSAHSAARAAHAQIKTFEADHAQPSLSFPQSQLWTRQRRLSLPYFLFPSLPLPGASSLLLHTPHPLLTSLHRAPWNHTSVNENVFLLDLSTKCPPHLLTPLRPGSPLLANMPSWTYVLSRLAHTELFLSCLSLPGKTFPPPHHPFSSGYSHSPRKIPAFFRKPHLISWSSLSMATFDVTPSLSSELSLQPTFSLSPSRSAHPFINSVYVFVSPTELWAPWRCMLCPSHWSPARNICLLNKWKQIYIIDLNKWMNKWNEHFLFIWCSSQCWERLRARGKGVTEDEMIG